MAESSSHLISRALELALTAADGLPLVSTKQIDGLFPANSAGKEAAREAQAAGLLRVLRTEGKGRSAIELCALTEKGLAQLLERSSPRPALDALLRAIDGTQAKIDSWAAAVAENRKSLDGLRALAERVLQHLQKPEATLPAWARNGGGRDPEAKIVDGLRSWHASGKIGDCPLPDLFEAGRESAKWTLGEFHDALRALHERREIYLHPWTGPLHELPHPQASLLVGHEIAYYASLRNA